MPLPSKVQPWKGHSRQLPFTMPPTARLAPLWGQKACMRMQCPQEAGQDRPQHPGALELHGILHNHDMSIHTSTYPSIHDPRSATYDPRPMTHHPPLNHPITNPNQPTQPIQQPRSTVETHVKGPHDPVAAPEQGDVLAQDPNIQRLATGQLPRARQEKPAPKAAACSATIKGENRGARALGS